MLKYIFLTEFLKSWRDIEVNLTYDTARDKTVDDHLRSKSSRASQRVGPDVSLQGDCLWFGDFPWSERSYGLMQMVTGPVFRTICERELSKSKPFFSDPLDSPPLLAVKWKDFLFYRSWFIQETTGEHSISNSSLSHGDNTTKMGRLLPNYKWYHQWFNRLVLPT